MKNYLISLFLSLVILFGIARFIETKSEWAFVASFIVLVFLIDKILAVDRKTKAGLTYKIDLTIIPNWERILGKLKPEWMKSEDSSQSEGIVFEYKPSPYEKMMNDPELEIDKQRSLFGKSFGYQIFIDENSGLILAWSDALQRFVDELIIRGDIFEGNIEKLKEKYLLDSHTFENDIELTPDQIGHIDRTLPIDWRVTEQTTIARIPYHSIVRSLLLLKRLNCDPMGCGILKFPDKIQNLLTKHATQYQQKNRWGSEFGEAINDKYFRKIRAAGFELSSDIVDYHTFRNKYYSLLISVKFFDKIEVDAVSDIFLSEIN
jgi:hypothetical protein